MHADSYARRARHELGPRLPDWGGSTKGLAPPTSDSLDQNRPLQSSRPSQLAIAQSSAWGPFAADEGVSVGTAQGQGKPYTKNFARMPVRETPVEHPPGHYRDEGGRRNRTHVRRKPRPPRITAGRIHNGLARPTFEMTAQDSDVDAKWCRKRSRVRGHRWQGARIGRRIHLEPPSIGFLSQHGAACTTFSSKSEPWALLYFRMGRSRATHRSTFNRSPQELTPTCSVATRARNTRARIGVPWKAWRQ